MRFEDMTLYSRDDEMDEYGDSGAYGESLEDNLDEEEEEEEESGLESGESSEPGPSPVVDRPAVLRLEAEDVVEDVAEAVAADTDVAQREIGLDHDIRGDAAQ